MNEEHRKFVEAQVAMLVHVVELAEFGVKAWKSSADRMYRASDGTWWKPEMNRLLGPRLEPADPPDGWHKLDD